MDIDLIVRVAEYRDLPALEWEGAFSHFRHLFADVFRQMQLGRGLIWIAERPTTGLVGQLFVSLNTQRPELADGETRAYLFGFRVRPNYQSQGIGSSLLLAVESDLTKRGFRLLTLNVGQQNCAARKFYERRGFRIVGTDPGHWSYLNDQGQKVEVDEPAWRMIKNLLLSS